MTKVLYKPVGMLVSVLGGVLAGAIFKQVWKVAFREDDAPKATDADRSWRAILLAAALQGAIFGLVKAAIDRGAAEGTRKVTGVWPGDEINPDLATIFVPDATLPVRQGRVPPSARASKPLARWVRGLSVALGAPTTSQLPSRARFIDSAADRLSTSSRRPYVSLVIRRALFWS